VKSGFVAVVGRPNVGKSSLVNALVGTKVAITSSRPQTTRNTIRGILNRSDLQIVFLDTPGIHRPRTALGDRLNAAATSSIGEADAAVFVLDATGKIGPGDRLIATRLLESKTPTVCVVNKVDAAASPDVTERLATAGDWDFSSYVPLSAKTGENVEVVVRELPRLLPDGPQFFPDGVTTDQADHFLAAEIIREKFLSRLREELPHSLAVLVDEITPEGNLTRIEGRLLVERDSQKGIVIGKGGSMLRDAGSEARAELEQRFDTKIHLEMRVDVEKDWQTHPGLITRLGM
jgi:GTP-binding protein Era